MRWLALAGCDKIFLDIEETAPVDISTPFDAPVELQIPGKIGSPWLSKDGRTIVFVHDDDLWIATR